MIDRKDGHMFCIGMAEEKIEKIEKSKMRISILIFINTIQFA